MNLLIALFPALAWGSGPIIATKVGGRPINQLLGTGYGQLIVGIILYLIYRPTITFNAFFWCFLGGLLWSIAQLMQFTSFTEMNVSTAMPISTGLQLIEIPLAGVIFWGEWAGVNAKIMGFISILILIVGITATSVQSRTPDLERHKLNYKAGLPLLIIGSLGYTACSVFPRIPNANGIVGLLPQTFGMFLGAIILTAWMTMRDKKRTTNPAMATPNSIWFEKSTILSIMIGVFGGFGTLAYLMSLKLNGVATSFPLTQMNVVVSTIGGIFILHEHKTRQELTFTIGGLILIIIAAFMIANN